MQNFSNSNHSARPLAAIGYIAVAVALYEPLRPKPWAIATLLAIPLLVVGLAIFQNLLSRLPGLVEGAYRHGGSAAPGGLFEHPNVATLAVLTLLAVAAAITHRHPRGFNPLAAALASVALGVSLMSGVVVLFNAMPPANDARFFLPSLPTTAQAIAISIAVLAWGGWPGNIPARRSIHGKTMRLCFPIVVIVPALNALIEVLVDRTGIMDPLAIDIIMAGANVAIFSVLVFWAISRVAAEHSALWETTNAMDSAPIVVTSLAGDIQHWSRGCEELYGWTAEQVVGRRNYEILQSQAAPAPQTARRASDPDHQEREQTQRCRDGTTLHVIERTRLVEAEGRPPVLVHAMIDITKRVRVEAALKESEATLAAVFEAHQIGTFDWSAATGKITVSAGMEQRFGLQTGDLCALAEWVDRIDPADLLAVLTTIGDGARLKAERFSFQYRMTVPNGGVRVLEGSGRLVFNAAGGLAHVVGVNIDATDRNEREAALRAEQDQFRLVLKTVPSAMVIFDELSIIKAISASAEELFGYLAEDLIGRHLSVLMIDESRERADAIVRRYLEGGTSQVTDGTRILQGRHRDGYAVPVELWIGDALVGSKRLFASFCKDLTEQLASEGRLGDMREELAHVSRLSVMGEMAAGLAHELNQPLAAAVYFLGAADLVLADNANVEQGKALMKLASEQTLRAGEIIRRMRGFTSREGIDMQVSPVAGIIDDAVALAFLGEPRFEIEIAYDLDPAAKTVLCDRIQIGQVLINLLRNATEELRKCAPTGRCITIGSKMIDTETIQLSVADTGPGLDLLKLDQLYMPFVSTKPKKGMGVGLSICRRIIEAHGGTFEAANRPGGGAIFCFTLSSIAGDNIKVAP